MSVETLFFDASAIMNLVKRGKIKPLAKGLTLDLALYECINALWKENRLLGKLNEEQTRRLADILNKLFKIIPQYSIRGFETKVLDIALKEGITVYDASYLVIAMEKQFKLVTDDKKLRTVASKYLNVLGTTDVV